MSASIWKTSRKFDIDDSSNEKKSKFDVLVRDNVIQKSLESDNLIFMEGSSRAVNADFIDESEAQDDQKNQAMMETLSSGDFEGEFITKFEIVNERSRPKTGIFDSSTYFEKIFPSFKIQKPGEDLYLKTNLFLAVMAIFVFMKYGQMSVDQATYLKNSNNSIFKGDMVICLLFIILVILIERYIGRSDTKEVNQNTNLTSADSEKKFFSSDEMFRTSTNRSMTVKLKTMNTSDLDIQD